LQKLLGRRRVQALRLVKLAVKWGYVATPEGDEALALLDRINARLWKLTHERLTQEWR
jgi:hypothetical protein